MSPTDTLLMLSLVAAPMYFVAKGNVTLSILSILSLVL